MKTKYAWRILTILTALVMVLGLMPGSAQALPASTVTFTILHTNDFHGQLEGSGSNPGAARMAHAINQIRSAVGTDKVLLVDAGDEMQGSLLSNLQKGAPVIGTFNAMGYSVATFGNHEFDWGQTILGDRTTQATYPYVTANIVVNDTANCATAGWGLPTFADAPYVIKTIGVAPNAVKVAFIGVTTTEVPIITVATATAGLCFKDPTASILHYYDTMKADGADVIVVLSHLGYADGGYGYGIPVIGDQKLAQNLIDAGKPVNLIIGGHSHTNLLSATTVGSTKVVQAYYNGRNIGRADFTVTSAGVVTVDWHVEAYKVAAVPPVAPITVTGWYQYPPSTPTFMWDATKNPTIDTLVSGYANDPAYVALVNIPIGYSAVDLPRSNAGDNMMGTFIDDSIYNFLNTDAEPTNDIDVFFNNAGGIRADWCWNGSDWVGTGCVTGTHTAGLLTFGDMFTVLPFGNATAVGTMTGAQILDVVNYGPNVAGVIQPAGLKYKYFEYNDANPGPQPWAWGAYDVVIYDKATSTYVPLDLTKTYNVGTNEFLAPAGGDGYNAFKYMKNITYWGDMLNAVNAYVTAHYTLANPYMGPNGDGTLDGRIIREGNDTTGPIVPLSILHNNDSHGNLPKTTYVGYTQLATLIKQEKLHNPTRTLLLNAGDQIQGDAMMYYFKSAPSGFAADGTALPPELQTHPMMAVMNYLGYDAMTLGNHEFNFGSAIFDGIFAQANFHILGANVTDTGEYGLSGVGPSAEGVLPYIEKTVGAEGIKVAILGITNHRVPNYELPSNIPGLTFTDPIAKAQELVNELAADDNDVTIALTHIGFTENPKSVEVDANVDTNLAMLTNGIDTIIGAHSHTDPSKQTDYSGAYKFLPTIIANKDGKAVTVTQAYRYNNYLGEIILGLRAKSGGGYEVVSNTGRYLAVTLSTAVDAGTKAVVDPYVTQINAYNDTVVGKTTVPIDTLLAFTQETNGANLQADASMYELGTHGITPDFHLSGAMTNKLMAAGATVANPVTLKISDMFAGMPYENSLVVISMNGPQLKTVLERAYRNYYYYKYVPGYGGYSYYTTCMIDTDKGNVIKYNDINDAPYDPSRSHVVSLTIQGHEVDFNDAGTYYDVSTVNYLAAGSCNFNNGGVSLWPLNQIVHDTQYYVRDAVIDYIKYMGTISPAIEGRLAFIYDLTAPVITIVSPTASEYSYLDTLVLNFSAVDVGAAGLLKVWAELDGVDVINGQSINLESLGAGEHTLTVYAIDKASNQSSKSVTFTVVSSGYNLSTGFKSNFTSNYQGWTIVNGPWSINANGYLKSPGIKNQVSSIIQKKDFATITLEAKMARKFGDANLPNRLHFRTSPAPLMAPGQWADGYIFQYTNAGYFSIWDSTGGVLTPIVPWTGSSAIVPWGWNTLKVVADGANMEFFINGDMVAFGEDYAHSIGRVGLSMWRGADLKAPFIVDWVTASNQANPENYSSPVSAAAGTGQTIDSWTDPNTSPDAQQ